MKTYPQGSLLTPKTPIALGKLKANPGQTFWVTNSQVSQQSEGVVRIARSGKNAGNYLPLKTEDIAIHFEQVTGQP